MLANSGLEAGLEKCVFFQKQVKFPLISCTEKPNFSLNTNFQAVASQTLDFQPMFAGDELKF